MLSESNFESNREALGVQEHKKALRRVLKNVFSPTRFLRLFATRLRYVARGHRTHHPTRFGPCGTFLLKARFQFMPILLVEALVTRCDRNDFRVVDGHPSGMPCSAVALRPF